MMSPSLGQVTMLLSLALISAKSSGSEHDDAQRALPPFMLNTFPFDQTSASFTPRTISDGSDLFDSRSLQMESEVIPADPENGLSAFEASGGVHFVELCTNYPNMMDQYENQFFCDFQEDPIPYTSLPKLYQQTAPLGLEYGIFTVCPDTKEGCIALNLAEASLESCATNCGNTARKGDVCSEATRCESDYYCQRTLGNETGICSACPDEPEDCLVETDMFSRQRCLECYSKCSYHYWGDFTVDDEVIWTYAASIYPVETASGQVIAPLADCSDLVLPDVETCPDAQDAICLIHNSRISTSFSEIGRKCEKSGGLAMVLYYSDTEYLSDDYPHVFWLTSPLSIPSVMISYNSGVALQGSKIGSVANLTTYPIEKSMCAVNPYCSVTVPCINENNYCFFNEELDTDDGLHCFICPLDPLECFFPAGEGRSPDPRQVESCAQNCASSLEFGKSCKTCGEAITGSFEFGVDDPADRCEFCPEDDLKYPDRTVPYFSFGERKIACWQVESFFTNVDIHKDSVNCKVSQGQNYICGCEGTGYAGANTEAKRNALVWMPRVAAVLSLAVRVITFHPLEHDLYRFVTNNARYLLHFAPRGLSLYWLIFSV